MSRKRRQSEITPEMRLRAYSIGLFPMVEGRDPDHLFWVEPEARGVFPLDGLKISPRPFALGGSKCASMATSKP